MFMKILITALAMLFVSLNIQAKIIYTDPLRNSELVSIYNNIIIGFDESIRSSDLNSFITVRGSLSGLHSGEIIVTKDRNKLIFKPYQPFAFNETVEVTVNRIKTSGTSVNNINFTFRTQAVRPEFDYTRLMENEDLYTENKNYVYADNSYAVPPLSVTVNNNPTPGRIYLNNFRTVSFPPHMIIANNDGTTYYTREVAQNTPDFKKSPRGTLTYFSLQRQKFYEEDVNYNTVDSFYCGNGYVTDNHDLKILPNGHAYVMSYDPQIVDMSLIYPTGLPNATVVGLIIQEIDENKNVVFQWRSWDHYNILDATHTAMNAANIDYVHGNAIEPDTDGNLMISARHLSEITKINRSTGAMMWRLGGVNNQFTFPNDSIEISYQHDIRRISNGHITMFDNGNYHTPNFSRSIEYQLDEVNKIATLVWEFRNTPDRYGPSRGSSQRLSNGNTFICWGSVNPNFTEVTPDGTVVLEMSLPNGIFSYRGYKEELSLNLNLKLAIEGFYNSSSNSLNIRDTVTAYLRSINSPYNIVDSSEALVDSVSLNGEFHFYNSFTGTYYITVKHRNSLETWSKSGGQSLINGYTQNYDMTDLSSKAYGNNLIQVDVSPYIFAVYSGDVNHDSFIDLTDVIYINNDAGNFVTGYVLSDLTGNNITDLTDVLIAYNNAGNFVSVVRP